MKSAVSMPETAWMAVAGTAARQTAAVAPAHAPACGLPALPAIASARAHRAATKRVANVARTPAPLAKSGASSPRTCGTTSSAIHENVV